MCTGGRIVGHLVDLLPLPETDVIFVGYQAAGTPGRAIQQAATKRGDGSVRLGGHEVRVRAQVHTLSGLSAHADRGELWRWLSAVEASAGAKRVALHHGEVGAQRGFCGRGVCATHNL